MNNSNAFQYSLIKYGQVHNLTSICMRFRYMKCKPKHNPLACIHKV